jgi:hypothetical protein
VSCLLVLDRGTEVKRAMKPGLRVPAEQGEASVRAWARVLQCSPPTTCSSSENTKKPLPASTSASSSRQLASSPTRREDRHAHQGPPSCAHTKRRRLMHKQRGRQHRLEHPSVIRGAPSCDLQAALSPSPTFYRRSHRPSFKRSNFVRSEEGSH